MKTILCTLVLMSQMANADVINCNSDENTRKKLTLERFIDSGLLKAELTANEDLQFLVGKTVEGTSPLLNSFTLFNQHGEEFGLKLKKVLNFPNHCRARYCPPIPGTKDYIAVITDAGGIDEYYSCL